MTCNDARLAEGAVVHAGLKPADPAAPSAAAPASAAASAAGAASPSSPSSSASPAQATASPPKPRTKDDVVFDTMKALTKMKREAPYTIFLIAVNTLIRLMNNVLSHPGEARYCRVRYNNSALQSKLFSQPGGRDAITSVGFEEHTEDGEIVFLMSDPPPKTL